MNGFLQNSQPLPQGFVEVFDFATEISPKVVGLRGFYNGQILKMTFNYIGLEKGAWENAFKINEKYLSKNNSTYGMKTIFNGSVSEIGALALRNKYYLQLFQNVSTIQFSSYGVNYEVWNDNIIQQPVVTPSNNFVEVDDAILEINHNCIFRINTFTNGSITFINFHASNVPSGITKLFKINPKYVSQNITGIDIGRRTALGHESYIEQRPDGTVNINSGYSGSHTFYNTQMIVFK